MEAQAVRIIVTYSKRESGSGSMAVAEFLPLAGFGATEAQALANLQRSVEVWCRALARNGQLEDALRRAGIYLEETAEGEIEITAEAVE